MSEYNIKYKIWTMITSNGIGKLVGWGVILTLNPGTLLNISACYIIHICYFYHANELMQKYNKAYYW